MTTARATRTLLRVAATALVAFAAAPSASAAANAPFDPPALQITSPSDGSEINSSTPVFTGTTSFRFNEGEFEDFEFEELLFEYPVTLKIYSGGGLVEEAATPYFFSGTWSIGPVEALAPGVYTAQAEQSDLSPERGVSDPVTFTVDATPPQVTLTSPPNASSSSSAIESVAGAAGVTSGDLPTITINLYAGDQAGPQAPMETLQVQAAGESWSATFGGLSPGSYTAQASQRDAAGNTGTSAAATFTVTASPDPPPPAASFTWIPAAPRTGESVSLVSSSTDPASPITAFAWALTPAGAFAAGKPVLTTSFATPGGHVVRLRVIDAAGRSSIATETVPVTARPSVLMQPFPVVRIVGSVTSRGANVRLLTVQAPIASRVTILCRGPGCKTKSESRVATASAKSKSKSKAGAVTLAFRRFQRPLRAGVVLQIRVSRAGEIGKYTGFTIRRNKLPVRVDACLRPASSTPMACPRS